MLCTQHTSLSIHHCFFLPSSPFLRSPFSLSLISIGATSPLLIHALSLPLLRPLFTSLLLAQQQHSPIITNHPTIAQALAIHMNTNISIPIVATILTDASARLITFLKIRNMTVAMMEAAVVNKADRKVKMAMGTVFQRLKTERGVRKMERKVRQAPMRKRANIQWEARRRRWRAEMTSAGRATVGVGRSVNFFEKEWSTGVQEVQREEETYSLPQPTVRRG